MRQAFRYLAFVTCVALTLAGMYVEASAQYATPTTPTTGTPDFAVDPATGAPTGGGGTARTLNITSATNIKTGKGRVYRVILNTAGSTASSVIDSAGTSVTAANTILTMPSTATAGTVFTLDVPFTTGLSVVTGTSAVIAVSYE